MSLPITLTYTFGTQTGTVPASYLDTNFSQITTALNGVGSGSVALAAPNITSFSNTAAILPVVNGGTASSTGNISALNVLASGSTTTRTLAARFGEVANAQDFGAVGDGATNDTTAILAWITYCITHRVPGYLPCGTGSYMCSGSTRLNWLLNNAAVRDIGLTIFGDGIQKSILDVTGISATPPVLVNNTNASLSGATYFTMTGIGFLGNNDSHVFQFGNADGTGPLNEPVLDIWVFNNNTNNKNTATATIINHVTNGHFRIISNVSDGTNGFAGLTIVGAQFSSFWGSCGANTCSMYLST